MGAYGNGAQDPSVPLDSVPDVYLLLAERDFDYLATAGDETGHQSCIWTVWELQARGELPNGHACCMPWALQALEEASCLAGIASD